MGSEEYQFWPFPVVPPEQQTGRDKSVIHFLETAYNEGFKPHHLGGGDYGASSKDREALILVRGKNKWEVRIGTAQETGLSAHLKDFECAATAALAWLRGADILTILEEVRPHLIVDRGKGGYKLY